MNKFETMKKAMALGSAIAVLGASAVPAMAASTIVDSVGSVAGDIATEGTNPATTNTTGITGYDDTQDKETEYTKDITGDPDEDSDITADTDAASCEVYATQASTFSVKIPKVIVLNGTVGQTNSGTYEVDVKGNIAGNEKVTVNPITNTVADRKEGTVAIADKEKGVYLAQDGKDDIYATIAQASTTFGVADTTATVDVSTVTTSYDDTKVTGTVTAHELTAGSWAGAFNFEVSLDAE